MESIEKIKSTYSRIAEEAQQESNKIQQAIYHTGSLRLLLFVAGIAGIIYFREESWTILAGIALVTLLPFILLIKYHNNLFRRKDYQEKRAEVNRQELAALDYDTSCFDAGEEFVDPAHLYAYDLDVFGTHSLFQYVNRTCTELGKHLLANWLGQHLEKKEDILERQAAVRELAPELQFRQHFRILGMLHKGTAADETELKAWAASPGVFRKNKFLRLLPATVTGINGICLLLMLTGYLPASMWGVIWTLFVTAGFAFTGKITKIQAVYGKKLQILGTYAGLLKLMEAQPMQCNLLKRIKEEIGGEQRKASLAISRLSKLMNELDQRNNVFMYVILNGLFFWELRQIMRIEAWKEQYARELPHWLSALGQMDALNSLATFAYNHPDYSYPTLLDGIPDLGCVKTKLAKSGFVTVSFVGKTGWKLVDVPLLVQKLQCICRKMENECPGIRLLARRRMAIARGSENQIIFEKRVRIGAAAVLLVSLKNNAQLIFVCMPVIAVIHNVVCKTAQMDIFPGKIQLIVGLIHFFSP